MIMDQSQLFTYSMGNVKRVTFLETIPEDSGVTVKTQVVNGYKVKDWG